MGTDMKGTFHSWLKAVQHATFVSTIVYLPITLGYLWLYVFHPEACTNFSLTAYFLLWFYIEAAILFLAHGLVTGRMTVRRWTNLFYPFAAYPAVAFHAYMVAAVPAYPLIALGAQCVSSLILIGIYDRKWFWLGSTWFLTLPYVFVVVIRGELTWILGNPGSDATLMLGWLSFLIGLVLSSRLFIGQDESVRRLLRNSRRDRRSIAEERAKADRLLRNILPERVAEELKRRGSTEPVQYDSTSVLFTDFQGFTSIAESMQPRELVTELDRCFSYFDALMPRHKLEKLKTIGDAYMCAGGLPEPNRTHAVDITLAALEIQAFMNQMKSIKSQQGLPYWELRIGIHSGPLVAGVIGQQKFAYDVWGDTVNTASRMESSGETGRVNISRATFDRISDFFKCEYRGRVKAKNKGEIEMYFVLRIAEGLHSDADGRVPNAQFKEKYDALSTRPPLFGS